MCYLGGEKMKLKIMKFFAVLLAALIGIGALKPCEAIEPLPLDVQAQLADLYYDYQNKKAKAINLSENLQASMDFYTKFENLPGKEGELYTKWLDILTPIILKKYPNLYNKDAKNPMLKIQKLAQENARYFVSIFTPTTTMGYTVSLRQLNYILYMMKDYIHTCDNNTFNQKLVPYLKEFISLFDDYVVDGLIPKGKNRKLSLFGDKKYFDAPDIFSYVYQTSFYASFSCMAQNHRHRSEHSFIYLLNEFKFYTPEIIEDNEELKKEWENDMKSIATMYPQGILIKIVQTGNLDTLLLKAKERACGQAQLEIMRHTIETMNKFKELSIYGDILADTTNNATAKCLFKNSACSSPCPFGAKQFERKI